jgi:peroxiredoxin Q/BCP
MPTKTDPILKEGDAAPNFKVQTDSGETLELKKLKGQNVVLYFYPKADTPGCTKEACAFRDNLPEFGKVDAVILGVSPDKVEKQAKFKEKYELPFTLLADINKEIAQAYGVWQEKKNYGRTYMGVVRTTFIIDKKGKISKIFPKVKVAGHAEDVLAALSQ